MTAERRAEIESLFERALELSPRRRDAWLGERCAGDEALRFEVDALLAAHAGPPGILEMNAALAAASLMAEPLRDRRIGPYGVVRELGRGGMGVVYLAERVDDEQRRTVAVKLLRYSPDAGELHRRFLAERRILASLRHPNIAQLLDGGTTDGQLPYLVMEYVDGQPITEYCDDHRLDVGARLRLFMDVCRAVHAAHQNLVIHSDIKPGNILVTTAGGVKLLDFGIAQLLNPGIGGLDVPHTGTELRVMTPEYASPEQLHGESLTTASDVYALGVVLYELLTGRRPFRLCTGTTRELYELSRARRPERPSAVVTRRETVLVEESTARDIVPEVVAANRSVTPERLRRQLRGDVDAILLRALRGSPESRYASAELLCTDIARHLSGLPIGPERVTRVHHLRTLLRSHRVEAAAAVIAASSLAAAAVLARKRGRARRSRRAATALWRPTRRHPHRL